MIETGIHQVGEDLRIYATIFDRSPEGLAVAPEDVTPEDAAFLQRIAWETVQEWREGTPSAE